jgi:tRNA(Ile)-lysidine synthase
VQVPTAVSRFLGRLNPQPGTVVVAFSGGPDSTALLHSLAMASSRFELSIVAAHLDHAIDSESSNRAREAERLAEQIGVPFHVKRQSAPGARRPGESLETAARRIRYDFLRRVAKEYSSSHIATAHHRDDQIETVLLRLLFGSGLAGVAAIPAKRDEIIRPLLSVARQNIVEYLDRHRLEAISDPTNLSLETPRNMVRHALLPFLRSREASIDSGLLTLASSARRAVTNADRRLARALAPRQQGAEVSCDRSALESLPEGLRTFAIGTLSRILGAPPPTQSALADLERQLATGGGVGCDLGADWRLEDRRGTLVLHRREDPASPFAYTLTVPGEIRLPELSLIFRMRRSRVEPWMFRGSEWRAGMALPLTAGDEVTIRSRRPGDRIQPYGCSYSRRLKEVLIDLKMPRKHRDHLPLLSVGDQIVWVPGVTIDHRARLDGESEAWVAEIQQAKGGVG